MRRHIEFVGLLHLLAGALTAVVAAAVFLLGLGALSIAWSGDSEDPAVTASVASATFIVLAAVLTIWALTNAWVGRELVHARRPVARLAALGTGVLHLFVLPFGTVLGVYSLWVLLHPEARTVFEGGPTSAHPR